jgi:hypothetical protein
MVIKKIFTWRVVFGLVLVSLSIAFYTLHYVVFHDTHHIFLYLIGDIAFLFLDVLIVALVLERIFSYREKIAVINKMNMLIGIFFIEIGNKFLFLLHDMDVQQGDLSDVLVFTNHSTRKDFARAILKLKKHQYQIDIKQSHLPGIKELLLSKRDFLASLLANPNLLEHQRFADLLWAVFHLMEELSYREDLADLSVADKQHLALDIRRAYQHLLGEWIYYLRHLKDAYPYLYSLAIRINPFDVNASVEIV